MLFFTPGSFPVVSLMVGAVVTRLVPDEGPPANITAFEGLTKDEQRILVSASLTFLVGLFQVHQPSSHYKNNDCFQSHQCVSSFYLFPAWYGAAAGGIYCHVPVGYTDIRIHHCSCCSHPGFAAQVCTRTDCAGFQWTTVSYTCRT